MAKSKKIYLQKSPDEYSTYMFLNHKDDFKLFVRANGFEEASRMFDLCDFKNRNNWTIYLKCGSQPLGSKK